MKPHDWVYVNHVNGKWSWKTTWKCEYCGAVADAIAKKANHSGPFDVHPGGVARNRAGIMADCAKQLVRSIHMS